MAGNWKPLTPCWRKQNKGEGRVKGEEITFISSLLLYPRMNLVQTEHGGGIKPEGWTFSFKSFLWASGDVKLKVLQTGGSQTLKYYSNFCDSSGLSYTLVAVLTYMLYQTAGWLYSFGFCESGPSAPTQAVRPTWYWPISERVNICWHIKLYLHSRETRVCTSLVYTHRLSGGWMSR